MEGLDQLLPLFKTLLEGGEEGTSPLVWALITLIASEVWKRLYKGMQQVLELFRKGVELLERIVSGDISLAVRVANPTHVVIVDSPEEESDTDEVEVVFDGGSDT